MLNFDKLMDKISRISPEEMQNMIYTALDKSGIEYEKGEGRIFYDGLPDITIEDIYGFEDIVNMTEGKKIELSYDVVYNNIEFYQAGSRIDTLKSIDVLTSGDAKKYNSDNTLIAA